jgi:hypothetical protein
VSQFDKSSAKQRGRGWIAQGETFTDGTLFHRWQGTARRRQSFGDAGQPFGHSPAQLLNVNRA